MRIRNGFVSNSSSSSFIISVKNSDECPHCHRKDANFISFMERVSGQDGNDDTKIEATTSECVIKYMKDSGCFFDSDPVDDSFEILMFEIKKEESDGNEVAYISISYHDSIINGELNEQIRSGNVKKIWSDDQ